MLGDDKYRHKWEFKKSWYAKNFPGQLIVTRESSTLSEETKQIIASTFGVEPVYEESK